MGRQQHGGMRTHSSASVLRTTRFTVQQKDFPQAAAWFAKAAAQGHPEAPVVFESLLERIAIDEADQVLLPEAPADLEAASTPYKAEEETHEQNGTNWQQKKSKKKK